MADLTNRPTREVSVVVLDSMDRMFEQLIARLEGLTDAEYLWEPVETMWSVRETGPGPALVEGAAERDLDPAPVTTIAWRLWHLAVDCFDSYSRLFDGDTSEASAEWTRNSSEAITTLQRTWREYRGVVASRDWWSELGDAWGPWSRHSVADMALFASSEMVHHGAEIALLRDLYRASPHIP
ncbi:DinB family protein [soil metagenome]